MIRVRPECKIIVDDYKEKIKTVFSTSYILKCHSTGNYKVYEDVFSHPKIQKMFADEELMFTAEQFLDNNLNLAHAGRSAFMHRNTMNYRIKNIKKITGLDLKIFAEAHIFSNMLTINNMIKEKKEKEENTLSVFI